MGQNDDCQVSAEIGWLSHGVVKLKYGHLMKEHWGWGEDG